MALTKNTIQDPGLFPARLLALATLQILANNTQFTSVRPVSLSTLTHVAARYLELLAQAARDHADYSARTQINAWDISGVLEHLQGPGALSSLQNWCLDHLKPPLHRHQSQSSDPVDKLADAAKNLTEFSHSPSAEPITTLSFLPLTDAEIAALDRAGQSEVGDDHPSPSYSSGSSEDDSDVDSVFNKTATQPTPSKLQDTNSPVVHPEEAMPATSPRPSIDDMPAYVPAHFPSFPGLGRPSSDTQNEIIVQESHQPINPTPAESSSPPNRPSNLSNQNPYLFTIPYSQSQLCELHGPLVASKEPIQENPPDHPDSPSRKKPRLSGSLEGFLQTYSYMVEEKLTNKSAEEPKFMKRNPTRYQFIAEDRVEPMHDSLFGSIPISSIRTNRWSAGWIPHPPSKDGQLLGVPELKPYGHTPLPVPVTMPVPIQFPPHALFHQPQPRIPDLIPRLFHKLSQQAKGDKFTLVNRMSRLGQPSELGASGEPLPYRIKDILPPAAPAPAPGTSAENPPAGGPSSTLGQPKYIEWGFHWPANEGRDPLPAPKPESDFKPREFPAMPKTTAEKIRLAQKDKLQPPPPHTDLPLPAPLELLPDPTGLLPLPDPASLPAA